MQNLSVPTTFSIDFVGGLTKVNDLISKARARIYYKYGNRNGTWITDEFAEKLNSTLSHVPIVGTYDAELDDFKDHSDDGQKRAYGFVPNEANIGWEKDSDGKEYLGADVYLWTGYWPEAAKIVNKPQSMEIQRETIVGDWKIVGGEPYFVYQSGSFKGLCALGNAVTPCFENSAFYALDEESRSFFVSLNEINRDNQEGGNKVMPNENEKGEFETVEPVATATEEIIISSDEFTEESPVVETEIVPTEDFEKVTNTTQVLVITTTEEEESGYKNTSIEQSERVSVTEYPSNEESVKMYTLEEYQAKELEVVTLSAQIAEFQAQVESLKNEISSLAEYKVAAIKNEKNAIIENFKRKLSEEEVSPFVESLDSYTTDELRTKLSVVLAEKMLADSTEVVKPQAEFVSVPTSSLNENGTIKILKKYKK